MLSITSSKEKIGFIAGDENISSFIDVDAFYQAYDRTPDSKEVVVGDEKEVWDALEKFYLLLTDEVIAFSTKKTIVIDSKAEYPCIEVARKHPLILFYSKNSHLKNLGFIESKSFYPSIDKTTDFKTFFTIIADGNFLTFEILFTLYPELKKDQSLIEDLIDDSSSFIELYKYLQLSNVEFFEGCGLEDRDWVVGALRPFLLRITKTLTLPFTFELDSFQKKIGISKVFSPECERKLVISLVKNLKIDNEKYPTGRTNASNNLYFLLSQGIKLQGSSGHANEQWFQFLPWEDIRNHQIFLFDHMKEEKLGILNYLSEHHPHLVYNHLLKGNFFIAQQLIEFGLTKPSINPASFLTDAIYIGLNGSKEIKKYHAIVLLQVRHGLIDKEKIDLLNDLTHSQQDVIQKTAEVNIQNLVGFYLETYHDVLVSEKEAYEKLSALMLAIEKDYALALSTIYNLPILDSETTVKFYRGVTIPKTTLNEKLVQHWLTHGHRASFYTFLGHGYNHGVVAELEKGPNMGWAGASDTTRVSPVLASNYARSNEYNDGFLLTMCYKKSQPVFFGNIRYDLNCTPNELEFPLCFPENIEGVYNFSYATFKVGSVFYNKNINFAFATFHVGESYSTFTSRTKALAETHLQQFLKEIEPYREQFSSFASFEKHLKESTSQQLISTFKQYYDTFIMRSKIEINLTKVNLHNPFAPVSNEKIHTSSPLIFSRNRSNSVPSSDSSSMNTEKIRRSSSFSF